MLGLMKEIKNRRETYASIAERYGVEPNTVWRWASGNISPSLDKARRLASDYGRSVEYLFSEVCDDTTNPIQPLPAQKSEQGIKNSEA